MELKLRFEGFAEVLREFKLRKKKKKKEEEERNQAVTKQYQLKTQK